MPNSQIKAHDKVLSERIEHLILSFDHDDLQDESCFHLNYSDTTYNQKEFARVLFQSIGIFALSHSEYTALKVSSPSDILRSAFDNITKNDSASDYGEALLFLILDYFFDVPKFVTKVRMRTAEKVPVFGFDCAHVSFEDDEICLWLGEAKLKNDFSDAADDAFESIEKFLELDELRTQVRLLRSNVEANMNLPPEMFEKIDKITKEMIPIGQFKIRVPILLATNSSAVSNSDSLEELREKLAKECKRRIAGLKSRKWPIVSNLTFDFILFPLDDKDELVKELKSYKA